MRPFRSFVFQRERRRATIFKGGTSLSKGWNLIQRFSEDIDLFLDPLTFNPPLSKKAIDRELKKLRDSITRHPALTFIAEESQTIGGFGRSDRFSYTQKFGGPGEVANRVLLESGTASGREPTTVVELRSYISQFLHETGVSLGTEDETTFPFRLLHFRRTFVEKLFAIHSKIELLKRENQPLGGYSRHYYDLSQLAEQPEVLAMLQSEEYATIKADYDQISRAHFPKSYFHPDDMSFAKSDALFPPADLDGRRRKSRQPCRAGSSSRRRDSWRRAMDPQPDYSSRAWFSRDFGLWPGWAVSDFARWRFSNPVRLQPSHMEDGAAWRLRLGAGRTSAWLPMCGFQISGPTISRSHLLPVLFFDASMWIDETGRQSWCE